MMSIVTKNIDNIINNNSKSNIIFNKDNNIKNNNRNNKNNVIINIDMIRYNVNNKNKSNI